MLDCSPNLDRPFIGSERTARMERTAKNVLGVRYIHEITNRTWAGRRELRNIVGTKLKEERRRAIANEWHYDLSRHKALAELRIWLDAELARLTGLEAAG